MLGGVGWGGFKGFFMIKLMLVEFYFIIFWFEELCGVVGIIWGIFYWGENKKYGVLLMFWVFLRYLVFGVDFCIYIVIMLFRREYIYKVVNGVLIYVDVYFWKLVLVFCLFIGIISLEFVFDFIYYINIYVN